MIDSNLKESLSIKEIFENYHDWYSIFEVVHKRQRVGSVNNSIKFYIYTEKESKHHAAHLHANYQNKWIVINLKNYSIMKGNLPLKKQREALKWVKNNSKLIEEKWDEFNKGKILPII